SANGWCSWAFLPAGTRRRARWSRLPALALPRSGWGVCGISPHSQRCALPCRLCGCALDGNTRLGDIPISPRGLPFQGPVGGRPGFGVPVGGPPDGTPVLLLHGFPQHSGEWDLVAPLLHASGYQTVALDQRGYSPGARPTDVSAYRIGEPVADALAVLDARG